jgi:hypothetical protein
MDTLDVLFRNPPAEARVAAAPIRSCADVLWKQMARRLVHAPGYDTPQPFTVRLSFAEHAACGNLSPVSPCC